VHLFRSSILAALLTILAAAPLASPVRAETLEEFFKGKLINLIVGYNPGGPYDVYARLAAAALPKYIPGNPKIIVQNMQGVGSAKAGDYLANQASRDGLTLGIIGQQLPVSQALGDASIKFDIRAFHWLGRFTPGAEATVIWHTSPTKTFADAMKRETSLASTSAGSSSDSFPLLMNRLAGTNFRMVKGYRGIAETMIAMERGETEGAHSNLEQLLYAKRDWLREKKAAVLVQYTLARHPSFPDAPAMVEFGKTPLDKQVLALFAGTAEIGRSMMTPPGVPADRLAALRQAFDAMVRDPAFKKEIEDRNLEFGPMSGAELQKLVAGMVDVTPEVVQHAIAASR
jgi:tripartite-type tricarboxylate transporter receptor subunit TctC